MIQIWCRRNIHSFFLTPILKRDSVKFFDNRLLSNQFKLEKISREIKPLFWCSVRRAIEVQTQRLYYGAGMLFHSHKISWLIFKILFLLKFTSLPYPVSGGTTMVLRWESCHSLAGPVHYSHWWRWRLTHIPDCKVWSVQGMHSLHNNFWLVFRPSKISTKANFYADFLNSVVCYPRSFQKKFV